MEQRHGIEVFASRSDAQRVPPNRDRTESTKAPNDDADQPGADADLGHFVEQTDREAADIIGGVLREEQ